MADLNTAIDLSKGKGRAACQAFTQRAMIHRLQGNDDLAREDFQAASNLGSEFAKAQVSNSSVNRYIYCMQFLFQLYWSLPLIQLQLF